MLKTREPALSPSSTIDLHEVHAEAHASDAAALLRCAWAAPCVRYSDSYVRWQLAFPATARPRAVMATDGTRPIGFVALLPRRIATGAGTAVVYVLSLFAVHPEYRGARIGSALASRIIEIADRPIVVYTEPESQSARVLARAVRVRGWLYRRLAVLRTYAGGPGAGSAPIAARQATAAEFVAAVTRPGASGVAWSQPTAEHAAHYLADPRGACLAVVAQPGGDTLGAALIVRAQLLTGAGAEDVPALESVHIHENHGAVLSAFRTFALHWSGGASVVTAANLHAMPAEAIRQAGFRATRSAFDVAILGDPADPVVQETTSTNLEVF
jgi:GNAT superfamily N-acetyltransferase